MTLHTKLYLLARKSLCGIDIALRKSANVDMLFLLLKQVPFVSSVRP